MIKKLLIGMAAMALAGTGGLAVQPCAPWVDPCPQADPPCYDCEAGGLFLGLEMVPWCTRKTCTIQPIFTVGWEGRPVGHYWTSWTMMFGMTNPVVLDDWYLVSPGVLVNFPRSYNVRAGISLDLWANYRGGQFVGGTHTINFLLQFNAGGVRLYAKPRLPLVINPADPYLGASLALGIYIVVPELFPRLGG